MNESFVIPVPTRRTIKVDYSLTVEQMLSRAPITFRKNLNPEHFLPLRVEKSEVILDLILVNRVVTTRKVREVMEMFAFRPGNVAELLAYVNPSDEHPWIIALGPDTDASHVAVTCTEAGEMIICSKKCTAEKRWSGHNAFLVEIPAPGMRPEQCPKCREIYPAGYMRTHTCVKCRRQCCCLCWKIAEINTDGQHWKCPYEDCGKEQEFTAL